MKNVSKRGDIICIELEENSISDNYTFDKMWDDIRSAFPEKDYAISSIYKNIDNASLIYVELISINSEHYKYLNQNNSRSLLE